MLCILPEQHDVVRGLMLTQHQPDHVVLLLLLQRSHREERRIPRVPSPRQWVRIMSMTRRIICPRRLTSSPAIIGRVGNTRVV